MVKEFEERRTVVFMKTPLWLELYEKIEEEARRRIEERKCKEDAECNDEKKT